MPHVERITARIIELLDADGWVVTRSDSDDEWTVSRASHGVEVVLVLPREDLRSYLEGLIGSYLPHEALDGVGTGAIEEELAEHAHHRLSDLLIVQGEGVATEVGVRSEESGPAVYSVRARHAAVDDLSATLEC